MKQYLLDATVLIQAKNTYYQKKIVPSFWKFLENEKDIFTIHKVKEEIKAGNDNLINLINNVTVHKYKDLEFAGEIADFITKKDYKQESRNKFFNGADFSFSFA